MFYLTLEDELILGNQKEFGSPSTTSENLAVIFEDDGDTGYLYALDMNQAEMPIVDALHIYNVDENSDKEKKHIVKICWDKEGMTALLLIDDIPLAAFNFARLVGYNNSQLPEPPFGSMWNHEKLDEETLKQWYEQE